MARAGTPRAAWWSAKSRRHYETLWPGFRLEPLDDRAGIAARKEAGLAVQPPEPEPTREALFAELERHVFAGDEGLERIVADLERRERGPGESARDLFAWARAAVSSSD